MDADLQVLMEQVRQRSHTIRSWTDLMKAARNNMKEKRSPLDADDRTQLQQCLEILHKTADVRTSRELFEHIEEIAVKAGLSLAPSPSSPHCRFVMAECFFIEIQAKENGVVDKVFINHGQMGSSKSSSVLVSLINDRKWSDVAEHLEGLVAGYNVTGDKSSKIEAFNALQALEQSVETCIGGNTNASALDGILRGPVGAFRPRAAGRSSRLHFFLTPYDMLDLKQKCLREPSLDEVFEKEIGLWAELAMASSGDIVSLQSSFRKNSGSLSDAGGKPSVTKLSAIFSLKLSEPMVFSNETINELEGSQGRANVIKRGNYVQLVQERAGYNSDTFLVVLPDQKHTYVFDSSNHDHLAAAMVSSVEFNDVNRLPSIISSLRQEALFAFAMKSILREHVKERNKTGWRFELTAPRFGHVDCMFESDECNGCNRVRFTVDDFDNLSVQVSDHNDNEKLSVHNEGTKAFQKCWSIPVTMRTVIKTLSLTVHPNGTVDDDDENDENMDEESDDPDNDDQGKETTDHRAGQLPSANTYDLDKFDVKAAYDSVYRQVCDSMPVVVDPMQFQELSAIDLPRRQNLLDLFKQIDVWEALIPPRAGQKPLKSPAFQSRVRPVNLPPFHAPTNQQQAGPSPGFGGGPAGISGGMVVQAAMGTSRSPKARHLSTASDTFEEMNELCNLSNAFAADDINCGPKTSITGTCSTPGEKPASVVLERKSSIQDTIESVLGSAMQPPSCGTPVPSGVPVSPIGSFGQHRSGGIMHSVSLEHGDISNTLPPHHHHGSHYHARSFSVAGTGSSCSTGSTTTTINLDVFDFDKSDSVDMGMFEGGPGQLQRWNSYHDPESASSYGYPSGPSTAGPPLTPGYDQQTGTPLGSVVAFRNVNAVGRGTRGRGAGGIPGGRRRSRRALNVGDRTMEAAMKELKKAERISRGGTTTRRPRRSRGTASGASTPSAQIVTSGFGEGDSPKFTLKILQQGATPTSGNPGLFSGGQESSLGSPNTFRPPSIQPPSQQQQGYFPVMQQQQQQQQPQPQQQLFGPNKESMSKRGYSGDDSEDGTELAKSFPDSTGGDEILRQQIQALRQQMLSNVNFGSLDDRSSDAGTAGMEKGMDESSGIEHQQAGPLESNLITSGSNLFENLATVTGPGNAQSVSLPGTSGTPATLSGESLMAKLRAGVKRRNSLDSVIGKLIADKTAFNVPDDRSKMSEIGELDADCESMQPAHKRQRMEGMGGDGEEQEYGQDDVVLITGMRKEEGGGNSPLVNKDNGESTPEGSVPGSGEGIKLVIKKSAIKIPSSKQSSSSRNPSGSKQYKTEKLSPGGANLKRTSPVVTDWNKGGGQQQQVPGEQKQLALAPSNRGFETLKQKMQEKKLKKQAVTKTVGEGATGKSGKGEKVKMQKIAVDQQQSPSIDKKAQSAIVNNTVLDKTPQKSATLGGVTGPEGIVFAKSLKGFKIPKIDDSGTTKVMTTTPPTPVPLVKENTVQSRKPPFHPQTTAASMPKPILKHSISTPTPANLASFIAANSFVPIPTAPATSSSPVGGGGRTELSPTFRPSMRRTLLPDPLHPSSNIVRPAGGFSGPHSERYSTSGDARDRDPYGSYSVALQEGQSAKYSVQLVQNSPDHDGLVIDDNPKSPNTTINTSTESASPNMRSSAAGGTSLSVTEVTTKDDG